MVGSTNPSSQSLRPICEEGVTNNQISVNHDNHALAPVKGFGAIDVGEP